MSEILVENFSATQAHQLSPELYDQVLDFLTSAGLDPNDVRDITIAGNELTATIYEKNKDGYAYLECWGDSTAGPVKREHVEHEGPCQIATRVETRVVHDIPDCLREQL